jgi:uncharacterized protein YcbK (DUF882 family)
MRPPEPTPGVGLGRVTGATGGENPAFLNDLARLAAFEHAPVAINSGYRSQQQQQQLWDNRASNPNPVARPGTSLHQQGLAADGTIGGRPLGNAAASASFSGDAPGFYHGGPDLVHVDDNYNHGR